MPTTSISWETRVTQLEGLQSLVQKPSGSMGGHVQTVTVNGTYRVSDSITLLPRPVSWR